VDRLPAEPLAGRLHVFVAFDWGESINLNEASRLTESRGAKQLARRPRTPPSIAYRPPPLRFPLDVVRFPAPWPADLPAVVAEAALFDFGGVSLSLQVPFQRSAEELRSLAGNLLEQSVTEGQTESPVLRAARQALAPLHERLLPSIEKPQWADQLWEEYFVFQFQPGAPFLPDDLLGRWRDWLAGLLRLEDEPLSSQEVSEALRLVLRYGQSDLFVPDWGAAVLLDRSPDCDETLQAIEFANMQLLEYRHIDARLDDILGQADDLLRRAARSRLPFWRGNDQPLHHLGELKVEANGLFERTGNVLKLVGDQYLARVYRLLATRFHLPAWERNIQRKLEVLEGIYEVISHQSSAFRTEFLEIVVIVLIAIEVVLAFVRAH
jgi:hypothetical protein